MKTDNVVPFGRSLEEYKKMFSLSDDDLNKTIVGISDGPASFNSEMHALGNRVVSVDPLYALAGDEIAGQFDSVVEEIITQVKATPNDWVWSYHKSPDQLRDNRETVLRKFLVDYEAGKADGRYVVGKLPILDLPSGEFHLALCSHFLFLYSDRFAYEFHRNSVLEMLRVAGEVRIFPLLTLMLEVSPHLRPLIKELQSEGFDVSVEKVSYELQRGGNEMLRIWKAA